MDGALGPGHLALGPSLILTASLAGPAPARSPTECSGHPQPTTRGGQHLFLAPTSLGIRPKTLNVEQMSEA